MSRREEPIEITAAPAPDEVDAQVDRGRDPPNCVERDVGQMPSLDPRHGALAHAGSSSKVGLPPTPADPEEADGRTDTLVAHPAECRLTGLPLGYLAEQSPLLMAVCG